MATAATTAEGGLDEPGVTFSDVFSLRKPKDAKAGLSSGMKSMAKGVVGGVVGLVAAPIEGSINGGVTGFARGVAQGVAGAVVLPIAGVTVGAVQVVRGIVNQPHAIAESSKGKVWDQEQRVWIESPGTALAVYDETAKYRFPHLHKTASVDYYELLQVPKTANAEQIKKQYYLLARKLHPDKNPDDPEAKLKFQQLGEAYQVLSNADLRARYDQHGANGLDVNFMDGAEFFNMLFGSELFHHLVGELAMATAARMGGEINASELQAAQVKRVDELVQNLQIVLKRYVVAQDEEGFRVAQQKEAEDLVKGSFGDTMLRAIGHAYEMQADIALAGFFNGMAVKWKSSRESLRTHFQVASSVLKVYRHQQRVEQWERAKQLEKAAHAKEAAGGDQEGVANGEPSGTFGEGPSAAAESDAQRSPEEVEAAMRTMLERAALEEEGCPLMLEAMWAANALDIQNTITKVCKRLLHEPKQDKQVLRLRALALKDMGRIFQEVAASHSQQQVEQSSEDATSKAKAKIEEAMFKMMEKRMDGDGPPGPP